MSAVLWITGYPRSGKTSIADIVSDILRHDGLTVVRLDGDRMREILPIKAGYTREERLLVATYYARLAKDLSDQGLTVVVSTVSLFRDIHAFNRSLFDDYFEVLIESDAETRKTRDQIGVYEHSEPVVGRDFTAELPLEPHYTIRNSANSAVLELANDLVATYRSRKG